MKTIAVDFDGVIHKYSKGWQDGSIYDESNMDVIKGIHELLKSGKYTVFILSTRSPWQIKRWMNNQYPWFGVMTDDLGHGGFPVQVIPFWKKFWDKPRVLGITKRKLPAVFYIDDRAVKYAGDWQETLKNAIL